MKTFDVAVVGAGLIGASVALELRSRNREVILLDRQQPGQEASPAAAGMLAPGPEDPDALSLIPLGKASLKLYPDFIAAVEGASGKPTGFARRGTVEVFFEAAGESARDRLVAECKKAGIAAEAISLSQARELEPSLGPQAVATAWLPEEAVVDPRLLTAAALAAAQARGVHVQANCEVTGLRQEGGRCTGVLTREGPIAAKHVVISAGCFSGQMSAEIGRYAPTRPVRGQIVVLRHPVPSGANGSAKRADAGTASIGHVLRSANGYLVPQADGRILAGSTLEDAGFDKSVTVAGVRKIMRGAVELVPALDGAQIVESWAGLRPGTPDKLPILGPTDVEGLIVATGHYRGGILLAPITGKLAASWVCGERVEQDVAAFSPLRFIAAARGLGSSGQPKNQAAGLTR